MPPPAPTVQVIEVTASYLARFVEGTDARTCPSCTHPIEAGQYVVHHRLPTLDFATPDVHTHVACLRELTEHTPEDLVPPAADTPAADARHRRHLAAVAADQRRRAA